MINIKDEIEKEKRYIKRYRMWYNFGYITTRIVYFAVFLVGLIEIIGYF